jgi:serine/threonine protein phosphatase PrpC
LRHRTHGVVLDFAGQTDPGLDPNKQDNEDSSGMALTPFGFVAAVCDGMGGHASGKEASETAVRSILESLQHASPDCPPANAITEAIQSAGRSVHALGGTAPRDLRPGSTCVLSLVSDRGLLVAHVGDSRALLLRNQSVVRLTRDHSLVQQMVDAGMLGPEAALDHPDANRITRALGMTPEVQPELLPEWVLLMPGDTVVLASDGLTDVVEDRELLALTVAHASAGLDVVCAKLVELANSRGGPDNITVQLVGVVETPSHATLRLEGSSHSAPTAPGMGLASSSTSGQALPTLPALGVRLGVGPTVVDIRESVPSPERTTLPDPTAPSRGRLSPPTPAGPSPERRQGHGTWLVVLGLLGSLGAAAWWFLRGHDEEAIPLPEPDLRPSTTHSAAPTEATDAREPPGMPAPDESSRPLRPEPP